MPPSSTLSLEKAQEQALVRLPGLATPPGILPNLVNPYNQQYLIVLCTTIILVVTTLLVAIRTYTRRYINKIGLSWDDCL